jgi:hypothetical protein
MKAASAQASSADGDVSFQALRIGDGGEVVMASFQTLRAHKTAQLTSRGHLSSDAGPPV